MKSLLKFLGIIQYKRVVQPLGFTTLYRLNPWNPLTYLALAIALIIGLFMYGFVGLWSEVNTNELKFKWV
jgi:hypothetical protein